MAKINGLDKMSYAELADMEAQIDRLKSEKQNAERNALRQRLVDIAKEHGFDIHDLFGKGRKGTVAVKYRDPKNPENTWTGRGRMPRWMVGRNQRRQGPQGRFPYLIMAEGGASGLEGPGRRSHMLGGVRPRSATVRGAGTIRGRP